MEERKMTEIKRLLASLREWLTRIPERNRLIILSLAVGICSGLAAVILEKLVSLIRHLLTSWFNGSADYILYLIYPGVGMLLSLLIVRYVIKDNIGHGVTKVLVAVSKNESKIKPHNMWSSIVTSALTIGFGGSVGAEAPIVYTGAAIGSNFARYMGLSYRNMTILLGCGAAGAISGIFKAPLAGVLFCLEILLFNISMTSIMPLLFSSVSATVVSYVLLGDSLPFECTLTSFRLGNLPYYVLLGFICGGVSIYFMRMTLWLEDKLSKFKNVYLKWIFCAGLLGILIFLFPPLYGEGYDSLSPLLNGLDVNYDGMTLLSPLLHHGWMVPVFFLLVLLLKVFSMTFTNSGGGVGGTFGPTLFVGAMTGFVMARFSNLILFGANFADLPGAMTPGMIPEQNFVLVGMAGTMAGVMQAPMTAIFLIAEISGGYELFIPLIVTSAISYGTMRFAEKYSIYTKRIAQSGDLLTHDSDQAVLTLLKVNDVIEKNFSIVRIDDTLGEFVEIISRSMRNIFPVVDSKNHFQGYVDLEDVRKDMFRHELYSCRHVFNYMHSAQAYVYDDEPMDRVMDKFEKTGAWNLPVIKHDKTYVGFVSKSKIFSAYRDELKELSQD